MSDLTTSISVVLYKSKTLSNGEHPIMMRVTKNRKLAYKSLGISCDPKLWDFEKQLPRKSHPKKEKLEKIINKKLSAYSDEALEMKVYEKEFTGKGLINRIERTTKSYTVLAYFTHIIERFKKAKKIGNAQVYKDAYLSLRKFTKDMDIEFREIDYSFLTKQEEFMRMNGIAETTMSVYFRTLRALYNKAIQENYARLQDYPFKTYKIAKFDTSTKKRALSKVDFKKIENLKIPETSPLFVARQYFVFSYYGYGINFVDMANLKWKDITGDRVLYTRAKTGKIIHFKLQEPSQAIIDYWKPISGGNPENYIFPILDKKIHKTPAQKYNRVHKKITHTNRDLKLIGKKAKLDVPITTYVARHTFATVLKFSGVNTKKISEMMGHQTESTTETYFKSFENEMLDEANENLL